MSVVTIYHNPRCGKSREALKLLEERGVDLEIVRYLDDPPAKADLEHLVSILDDPPEALVRTKDKKFKALGVDAADCTSAGAVVDLLVGHPEVMERAVVVRGDRAVVARPPEKALDLLG